MSESHGIRAGRTLHVGCPNVGDRELFNEYVDKIFKNRWFTNGGEFVEELERRLCEHLQVRHCITVCNATLGLELACRAMGLSGEVILPSFTFVATAHAVALCGLTPVFADIDPATHSLCPRSVESLISARTSAILGVHLWGRQASVRELQDIANRHQVRLLFDAAHAFHCKFDGTMVGNFGDCEVFSFHATKFFNTFEGGAIATNDDALANRLRLSKNFGFNGPGRVELVGTNAKMPEISAAMGLSMFDRLEKISLSNHRNYLTYESCLSRVPGLRLFPMDTMEQANWQYVVLEISASEFGATRDQVLQRLTRNHILAKPYFSPGCHRVAAYRQTFLDSGRSLPATESLCERVLCLPTGTSVTPADIRDVCNIILKDVANRPGLSPHFRTSPRKVAS